MPLMMKSGSHIITSTLPQQGWYSKNPRALKKELASYFRSSISQAKHPINTLILPHAGYRYSGQTAAAGLYHIQNRSFNRIIVLGPSHHYAL